MERRKKHLRDIMEREVEKKRIVEVERWSRLKWGMDMQGWCGVPVFAPFCVTWRCSVECYKSPMDCAILRLQN